MHLIKVFGVLKRKDRYEIKYCLELCSANTILGLHGILIVCTPEEAISWASKQSLVNVFLNLFLSFLSFNLHLQEYIFFLVSWFFSKNIDYINKVTLIYDFSIIIIIMGIHVYYTKSNTWIVTHTIHLFPCICSKSIEKKTCHVASL